MCGPVCVDWFVAAFSQVQDRITPSESHKLGPICYTVNGLNEFGCCFSQRLQVPILDYYSSQRGVLCNSASPLFSTAVTNLCLYLLTQWRFNFAYHSPHDSCWGMGQHTGILFFSV